MDLHGVYKPTYNWGPHCGNQTHRNGVPGIMMRTFRSGFAGFTLRMVMPMPLSLQYGSLGEKTGNQTGWITIFHQPELRSFGDDFPIVPLRTIIPVRSQWGRYNFTQKHGVVDGTPSQDMFRVWYIYIYYHIHYHMMVYNHIISLLYPLLYITTTRR